MPLVVPEEEEGVLALCLVVLRLLIVAKGDLRMASAAERGGESTAE